jgi:aryl-alcohol dehydrogenase-like predicted oxidoreductase
MIDQTKNRILCLGTANFGMPYGISRSEDDLGLAKTREILDAAWAEGFTHLDTATAYVKSEQILGELASKKSPMSITTKLRASECGSAESIVQAVTQSLHRTKQSQFWSVLLHDAKVLINGNTEEVVRGLENIVDLGLTEHVGLAAYGELEIIEAKAIAPAMDVFHIADNVCDQRLKQSIKLEVLASEGNKIFIRSIFLQGLLLMDPNQLPKKVESAYLGLRKLQEFCDHQNISILELCAGYARSIAWSSGFIIGAASSNQVREISNAFKCPITVDYSSAPKLDDWILDSRNWS